jgi:hypothetical protein
MPGEKALTRTGASASSTARASTRKAIAPLVVAHHHAFGVATIAAVVAAVAEQAGERRLGLGASRPAPSSPARGSLGRRLLTVSGRDGRLLRREPDRSLVTYADLSSLSELERHRRGRARERIPAACRSA